MLWFSCNWGITDKAHISFKCEKYYLQSRIFKEIGVYLRVLLTVKIDIIGSQSNWRFVGKSWINFRQETHGVASFVPVEPTLSHDDIVRCWFDQHYAQVLMIIDGCVTMNRVKQIATNTHSWMQSGYVGQLARKDGKNRSGPRYLIGYQPPADSAVIGWQECKYSGWGHTKICDNQSGCVVRI